MLEASIQLLEDQPQSSFTLLSVYPDEDRAFNHRPDLEVVDARPARLAGFISPLAVFHRFLPPLRPLIERMEPAIKALAQADALLEQGGISFSDGREKFLPFNVATVFPAIVMGVPVVRCAQALGPFQNRLNRLVASAVLPRMHTVVARGEKTSQHLASLGLDNVVDGVDLAFSLEVDHTRREAVVELVNVPLPANGEVSIGVCPSEVVRRSIDHGDDSAYAASLAALIDGMVLEGYRVTIFSHSSRVDASKRHNNDLPLCEDIHARVADSTAVTLVDQLLTASDLRLLIGSFDVVATSRFHAMISALCEGVPPIVLGWGHKYREVLHRFDMEDAGLDAVTVLDTTEAMRVVRSVVESRSHRRSLIERELPSVRHQAAEHRRYALEAAAGSNG
jgi:colanic acid/amylovoran biosynthesis protein